MSTLVDAEARRRALDPKGSFIVQAPAGSGKTELLTRRFLVLLARVERPEEILAITFTRKAAAEMRERILGALEGARERRQTESPRDRETLELAERVLRRSRARGWDLVSNPGRLKIQTIDSFLASLVAQMPWLSRLGAPPEIADRPEDLYEAAANGVLAHLERDDRYAEALARVLSHLDNNASDLRSLLVDLLGRRDQWLRHRTGLVDPESVRPELEQSLAAAVERGLRKARDALESHGAAIAELASYAATQVLEERPIARLNGLKELPDNGPGALPLWRAVADLLLTGNGQWRKPKGINRNVGFPPGKGEPAERKARMGDLLESLAEDPRAERCLAAVRRLPDPGYSEGQWTVVAAVIRVVDLALGHLWEAMGRQRRADFVEVALRGLQALGDVDGPSELLLALDRRLTHLLVDEFQDTSFIQYYLIERLTEGWNPGDGRTLFLVGDPMQSIYRFREAEVGLFLRAQAEGIGPVRLAPLRLEANFRSQGGVVSWVNRAFERVFPGEPDPGSGAVPYSPSVAVHPGLPGAAVELRPSLGHRAQTEAREVAEAASEALSEGTVAVLARSRTHLPFVLRALEAMGLPYRARDLDPLADRPAVRDIVSLARALLHPGDRLAWLAVLRAPWCGLSLVDLHALAGGSDRPVPELVLRPGLAGDLSAGGADRLDRAWAVLGGALGEARRRGLRAWVEGTWTALGAPSYLTDQEMADAEATFDLIDRLDRGGEIRPLQALDGGLEGLFASPDPAGDTGLHVMTIHRAKGLEFDTVLIPGLGRVPRAPGRRLLYWHETVGGELLLAPLPPRAAGARDPIVDHVQVLEDEKDRHERARLLYVAATRAKKRAVLWGHAEVVGSGEPKPRPRSLLEVLWPAVEESFLALSPGEEAASAPERSGLGTIRRLRSGWSLPEPNPPVAAVAEEVPEASELTEFDPEFEWAGETARHVGTAAHRVLERVAVEGLEGWDRRRVEGLRRSLRAQLTACGAAGSELDAAVDRTVEVVCATLEDPKGRWVLASRSDARSELALTGRVGGQLIRGVVDRTFVDDEGSRWIVDFKTSTHEGGGAEAFLDMEVERYRDQLHTYASLLRPLEPGRRVRAALYYPLLKAWREVDV